MMNGLLGRKVGMTQVFATNGELIPVTVIEMQPNVVTQVKTEQTDGYNAIQVGVEDKRDKLATKAELGHAKKANTASKREVKEFRLTAEQVANYELGQTIDVSIFAAGDLVDVQGTSKGKGFQGVIKRHGQATGPMAHGSRFHRRPGSMGDVASKVFKGKNLPGQTGHKKITVQNLEVVMVDVEKNAILVKGNVPGAKKSFVAVKNAIKTNKTKDAIDLVSYKTSTETSAE
jgi:large subunit ribosomal protein L3